MLPNPYTPGGAPRVFVGRDVERARIRGALARTIAYGEMAGPLTVVTGPRGVGKTSLLRDIQAQAVEDGFVVAWASGVKHHPFLADVLHATSRALTRSSLPTSGGQPQLKEVGVELGVGIAKLSATFARGGTEAPVGLVSALEDFFHDASTAVRERGGAGLLVVIDEIHEPLESQQDRAYDPNPQARVEAAALLNAVQNMDGERTQYPVAFLGAGLPHTKALLTRAATFGERTNEVVLGELDEPTARAVLSAPSAAAGVTWDADALDMSTSLADGYPQSLQIIGSAAWDAAAPEPGDRITRADVVAGRPSIESGLVSMYTARWQVATPAERALLRAMAAVSDERARRSEVASVLGVDPTALGMARRSLIHKGIVSGEERGWLRFTMPGFAAYVREQPPEQ